MIFLEKEWEKYIINKLDNKYLLEKSEVKDRKDYVNSVKWKSNGQITTHSPSTYKIPAVNDMPENFYVEIFTDGKNKENVVNKSKTTGEPPLMNAMSVFFAIKDAISSIGNYDITPLINAPATPEKILMSINNLKTKL